MKQESRDFSRGRFNKREYLREMEICAHTAREACVLCKDAVRLMDGRNAFRPSTNLSKDDLLELERLPGYVVQLKPATIAKIKNAPKRLTNKRKSDIIWVGKLFLPI